jgi:hypothetical protein
MCSGPTILVARGVSRGQPVETRVPLRVLLSWGEKLVSAQAPSPQRSLREKRARCRNEYFGAAVGLDWARQRTRRALAENVSFMRDRAGHCDAAGCSAKMLLQAILDPQQLFPAMHGSPD